MTRPGPVVSPRPEPVVSLKLKRFGTYSRVAVVIVVTALLLLSVGFAVGVLGTPTVSDTTYEFGAVNESTTEIRTTVTADTPWLLERSGVDMRTGYVVSANEIQLARSDAEYLDVESGSMETTAHLDNERISEWWTSHLANDERSTLLVETETTAERFGVERSIGDARQCTFETSITDDLENAPTEEIDAELPLIDDPVLSVTPTHAAWTDVGDDRATLEWRFEAKNHQGIDIPVTELEYTIYANDVVVGEGETRSEHLLEGESTTDIETETVVDAASLQEWWVTHLENDERTDVRIEFDAQVTLGSGDPTTVSLDPLTRVETVETDLLGDDSAVAGECFE